MIYYGVFRLHCAHLYGKSQLFTEIKNSFQHAKKGYILVNNNNIVFKLLLYIFTLQITQQIKQLRQ